MQEDKKMKILDKFIVNECYSVYTEFSEKGKKMFDKLKGLYELQKQASTLKKELNQIIIETEEENGTIKIVMNGEQKIQSVTIAPEWFSVEKKEKLEQALKKCFTKAAEKIQLTIASKLGPMAKNLKFPT